MKFISDLVARGRYCYSAEEAVGDLRDSEITNIPSPILASGHLGPILNRKILDVARYARGFAQSNQPNLTQIQARSWYICYFRVP
ncbi:MAG: hypothetical protein V1736_08515 [Pseudomonadota bacterium]